MVVGADLVVQRQGTAGLAVDLPGRLVLLHDLQLAAALGRAQALQVLGEFAHQVAAGDPHRQRHALQCLRRFDLEETGRRLRTLIDAGVKICISSDDPPLMEGTWVMHNILLARKLCSLTEEDIVQMMKDAVEISWADQDVKTEILAELGGDSYRSGVER